MTQRIRRALIPKVVFDHWLAEPVIAGDTHGAPRSLDLLLQLRRQMAVNRKKEIYGLAPEADHQLPALLVNIGQRDVIDLFRYHDRIHPVSQ